MIEDAAQDLTDESSISDSVVSPLEHLFLPNTPAPQCNWYDHPNPRFSSQSLLHSLRRIRHRYEQRFKPFCVSRLPVAAVADRNNIGRVDVAKKFRRRLRKLYASLEYSVEALGLWCARESARCLLKKVKDQQLHGMNQPLQTSHGQGLRGFLRDALRAIDVYIKATCAAAEVVMDHSEDFSSSEAAVESGLLTPKVLLLVNCLLLRYREFESKSVGEQPRCIVLVDKVLTAMVLPKVLSRMGCLSFCDWKKKKKQKEKQLAIFEEDEFKDGRKVVNVLITTHMVGEEGLHIIQQQQAIKGGCYSSCVILFDMLSRNKGDLRQWRGRRVRNSLLSSFRFIIFLQNGNQKHFEMQSELMQKNQTSERAIDAEISREEEEEDSEAMKNYGGRKKKKKKTRMELHSTAVAQSLAAGDWIRIHATSSSYSAGTDVIITLHAYKLCFNKQSTTTTTAADPSADPNDHLGAKTNPPVYADFALLLSGAIDEDILKIETELHVANNYEPSTVTAKIYACGTCTLDSEQLQQAKAHQQLMFDCLWSSNPEVVVAAEEEYSTSWRRRKQQEEAYLLLPLISAGDNADNGGNINGHGSSSGSSTSVSLDWEAVGRTAAVARMLSDIQLDNGQAAGEEEEEEGHGDDGDGGFRMACRTWASAEAVRGMAVVTVHTGKKKKKTMYCVMDEEVSSDSGKKNAECRMEGWKGSYVDYYAEKHNVTLKHPHQPLLEAKQLTPSKLRNYLLDNRHAINCAQKNSSEKMKKKNDTSSVHLPPELCLLTGISSSMVSSLYLFPSFMHRLHALILATQLRHTIATHIPACSLVHPSLIMEALTTVRCSEGFSLEGLELLGDSFLKYVVSSGLYLAYDTEREGQLSARRSKLISNENLHRLAVSKGLAGYIRDEPFQPDTWRMRSKTTSSPCRCNNVNLHEDGSSMNMNMGKSCSEGHRWICSKTIADAVEALVGAFVVSEGGPDAATGFIKWMGIMDMRMMMQFDSRFLSLWDVSSSSQSMEMAAMADLETQLCYEFRNRSLLVRALTHGSHDPSVASAQLNIVGGTSSSSSCYQRLEFLGDSVLDFLITRHLFITHPGLSPGLLSDLRSAAVNNECFARAALKHGLHRYLCHGSSALQSQVTDFVRTNEASTAHDQVFGWEGIEGPKVLGDLIESIAGAVLVDSGFDLETVWRVMLPLLSPLVTPATLPLHPIRELHELCQSRRIPFLWKKIERNINGDLSVAEAQVTINCGSATDEDFTVSGSGRTSKTAKKNAAQNILSFLVSKGIIHPRRRTTTQEPVAVTAKNIVPNDEKMDRSARKVVARASRHHRRYRSSKEDQTIRKVGKRKRCGVDGGGPSTTKNSKKRKNHRSSDPGSNVVPTIDGGSAAAQQNGSLFQVDSKVAPPPSEHAQRKMKKRSRETVKHWGGGASAEEEEEEDMEKKKNKYARGMEEWGRGRARSLLNELCMKKKWSMPEYVEEEGDIDNNNNNNEGGGVLGRCFTFSACIIVPSHADDALRGRGGGGSGAPTTTKCRGDAMPTKNDAKDNVATKILLALYNCTLGST